MDQEHNPLSASAKLKRKLHEALDAVRDSSSSVDTCEALVRVRHLVNSIPDAPEALPNEVEKLAATICDRFLCGSWNGVARLVLADRKEMIKRVEEAANALLLAIDVAWNYDFGRSPELERAHAAIDAIEERGHAEGCRCHNVSPNMDGYCNAHPHHPYRDPRCSEGGRK